MSAISQLVDRGAEVVVSEDGWPGLTGVRTVRYHRGWTGWVTTDLVVDWWCSDWHDLEAWAADELWRMANPPASVPGQ